MIDVQEVWRVFRSRRATVTALSDICFAVEQGSFVAVTGRSGSGKTTLLNLIGGLDRPDRGTVTVLGQRLEKLRQSRLTAFRRRSIGYVFQDSLLLPGLTALENVVAGRLPNGSWRELVGEARDLLGAIGLGKRADFLPDNLSGGERQRVSIARALLTRPPLLLADEPTGNLDPRTTQELLAVIADLQRDMALTVVVATHDPEIAAFAQRKVVIAEGRIAAPHAAPHAAAAR